MYDLCLSGKEHETEPIDNSYVTFYKARQALDIVKKFKEYCSPSHDVVVDVAVTGFRGRFYLIQCVPRNSWYMKAWCHTDSGNLLSINCQIY